MSLRVGVLEVELFLHGVHSLKEKRGIIKRLLNRVRERYDVAAAEVAMNDLWQSAGLGFACVGNDVSEIQSRLSKIVNYIDESGLAVVSRHHLDVIQ